MINPSNFPAKTAAQKTIRLAADVYADMLAGKTTPHYLTQVTCPACMKEVTEAHFRTLRHIAYVFKVDERDVNQDLNVYLKFEKRS